MPYATASALGSDGNIRETRMILNFDLIITKIFFYVKYKDAIFPFFQRFNRFPNFSRISFCAQDKTINVNDSFGITELPRKGNLQ